jgi:hypothetical protein
MTITANHAPLDGSPMTGGRSKDDPNLLELWEIKRQLNAEANYDIAELAHRASTFDLATAMKKLGVPFNQAAQIVPSQVINRHACVP